MSGMHPAKMAMPSFFRSTLDVNKTIFLATMIGLYPATFARAAVTPDEQNTTTINQSTAKPIKLKKIEKTYRKLLIGEKNIASAMSIVTPQEIKTASSSQSIYSILKSTPSVNEFQQNIGPIAPVLTVRGVRSSQLAQTLDGIPMISLLSGGEGSQGQRNVGTIVSTGQIDGIHVYPGVAPPDRQGFATVGGTISYSTKSPTDKFYADLFTKIGSFSTDTYGVEVNSGVIPNTGGLKVLLRLSKTQTAGYIQNTPAKYTDFLFSAIKPYDNGLSKVTATLIRNSSNGYFVTPVQVASLNKYGIFYNYPLSGASQQQISNYTTAILGDSTYINSHFVIGGKLFYIHRANIYKSFVNQKYVNAAYPYQVNAQGPYFSYGPIGPAYGNNNNFTYNPQAVFGSYTAGETSEISNSSSNTIGAAPKVNIFLPHNDITIGGLVAQQKTGNVGSYIYGSLAMPETNGYNALTYGGTEARTVYSGYFQDNMSFLDNSLHIEPGVTITGVQTSNNVPFNIYNSPPYSYSLGNYNKEILPYLGLSYDVTKNVIIYGSYGKGARFAPVNDYVLGPSGSSTQAPGPETVNAYEAGVRYASKRLYLNFDGYLQNMHGLFSFYSNPLTGLSEYANIGEEQMKGLEFSGKYLLTHKLSLSGNASYNKANYMNSFAALVSPNEYQPGYVFAGDPLADVPNWLLNGNINWHSGNLRADLNGQYTGSQVTTYELPPTESNPVLANAAVPNPSVRLPGYFLLNLSASYKIPIHRYHLNWLKVSLNIDNILDNHYYVHEYQWYKFYGFVPVDSPYSSAVPGEPRFIEVGLTGRFS